MRIFFVNKTWKEIVSNPYALMAGKDYYHVLLKFLISRVSDSREFFCAVNCTLYSAMFLFFFNQFKIFYKNFLPVSCGILLLCVVFTVEFSWYQGVRFWIGVFYFAAFYLRFINTGKKRFLILSAGCVFFHYTLVNILLILIANWLLSKIWVWFRAILLGISFIVRSMNIDFMKWIIKNVPELDLGSRTVGYIHDDMQKGAAYAREHANVFYAYRLDLMLVFGILILMVFVNRRVKFNPKYLQIFFFALTIYTFVNFGYAEMILYARFFKIAILMFYTFLFITAYQNYDKIKGVSLIIMILAFVPMVYAILSSVIEMRAHLFEKDLWFGNFLSDWNGGFSSRHGKQYTD
ncbi:MAG: hypothetical protein IKW83_03765 [Muribaculaceae bacterium]|nr:hypothetical protein [Muribaculaceae bacterium]